MNILISVIRVIGTQLNLNLSIEFGCGVANKAILFSHCWVPCRGAIAGC